MSKKEILNAARSRKKKRTVRNKVNGHNYRRMWMVSVISAQQKDLKD